MPWIDAMLRDQRVFAKTNTDGSFAVEGGRVEIRYRLDAGKTYRAAASNLVVLPGATMIPDPPTLSTGPADAAPRPNAANAANAKPGKKAAATKTGQHPGPAPEGAWIAYADGACSG